MTYNNTNKNNSRGELGRCIIMNEKRMALNGRVVSEKEIDAVAAKMVKDILAEWRKEDRPNPYV